MNLTGKLYVVGLGPGDTAHLTPAAAAAIAEAEVVTGYGTYLDLIPELLRGKESFATGMRQEVERCREALRLAREGRRVALVCSGDAGVYGMAGLVLELADGEELPIEIVPGVSAVQAAAARLGAPLMHDFAVISLSDLLTPWETICRRLEAAAAADFVVALYNPKSRGRTTQLDAARAILLRHRAPATPVGIVRNACRADESLLVSDLAGFPSEPVDMFSLVIVGNSSTFVDAAGRMVTPRGYETKSQGKVKSEKEKVAKDSFSPFTFHFSPGGPARALFVGGTASDVGKSVVVAGLCRLLRRRGVCVAPFKAQNMALNSAVTPEGGEIGRAQALQAAACGIPAHTDMNPVLLKPNSETGSQVVVHGRPVGNMSASDYHAYKERVWPEVEAAYRRLALRHQAVILEGAGSVAEINLKERDITNLRAARLAGAPVLLVADIDRGGVFASILGTLQLLDPGERRQVIGVLINRFRGDADLLRPGIDELERRTGIPVLGVIPWFELRLPEEDSVALERKSGRVMDPEQRDLLRVGVVRLPRLSNYTDFDPLEGEPDVELIYLRRPEELRDLDLLILPGSKSTLGDLAWLEESGFRQAILDFHARGGRILGICGGFQMLGREVTDPDGVEGGTGRVAGLGLLGLSTRMLKEKQTHQAEGVLLEAAGLAGLEAGSEASGYEIHMGDTVLDAGTSPLLRLTRRSGQPVSGADGAVSGDGRVWGTYLHDILACPRLRGGLLDVLADSRGLPRRGPRIAQPLEESLDRWADHLEQHVDLQRLWAAAGFFPEEG